MVAGWQRRQPVSIARSVRTPVSKVFLFGSTRPLQRRAMKDDSGSNPPSPACMLLDAMAKVIISSPISISLRGDVAKTGMCFASSSNKQREEDGS